MRNTPTHFMKALLFLVLSMVFLSVLDASVKWVIASSIPILVVAWFRYVVHLVLVVAIFVPLKGHNILRSKMPQTQVVRGVVMLMGSLSFFTTLHYLPQAEATALNFLAPLLVLSTAPWLLRETSKPSRWVATGIAFLGMLIIIRPSAGLSPIGITAGLFTACCFAAQYIITRRLAAENPLTSVIWSGALGSLGLSCTMPFLLPSAIPFLQNLSFNHWLVLLSTGITGALGHLFQIAAYGQAPASTLAPFVYLQIISSTAMGWLVWQHFPDNLTLVGIAIICSSGMTIGFMEWRKHKLVTL